VSQHIKSECGGVRWKDSFATLGRFDLVDVVESDDPKQVEKAAMLIGAYGHSTTDEGITMDEEAFNLSLRKFLKHFGVTAQREVEKAVYAALKSGKLQGTETLKARAKLEIAGLETDAFVEGDITLA